MWSGFARVRAVNGISWTSTHAYSGHAREIVYESPQVDMGYDIANYRAIHPPYGTMGDVEALIQGLHDRNMKFVMDLVVNHTSDQVYYLCYFIVKMCPSSHRH
jgi:1,4-alpha-glucan branching enzyme